MACYQTSIGNVPSLSDWSGLEPVCKIPPKHVFNQIECPLKTHYRKSKLCDLLPPGVTDSLIDFFANLPVIVLFVASAPARIVYCVAYSFLVNFDSIVKAFQYTIVNTSINFMTNPLVYLAVGLEDGENQASFNVPYLVGILKHACFPSILKTIYQIVGTIFYFFGYAIGFVLGLFIDLYDILLYSVCVIATFSLTFGLCLSFKVLDVFGASGGIEFTIYPFSFISDFLQNFVNCGCVLGSYPSAYLVFCLAFGGNCPSSCPCGLGYSPPTCSPVPSIPAPKPASQSYTLDVAIVDFAFSEFEAIRQDLSGVSNFAHNAYNFLSDGLSSLGSYVNQGLSDLDQDFQNLKNEITGQKSESSSESSSENSSDHS